MVKRVTLKYKGGRNETHFVEGNHDMAICGCDIIGDADLGYSMGTETREPVTCEDCLNLVNICKTLQLKPEEKYGR